MRITGDAAKSICFRFSTKIKDSETGLVYYGYRYYDPKLKRWVNRDPIGEMAGEVEEPEFNGFGVELFPIPNLYGFGPNSPNNGFDTHGEVWREVLKQIAKKIRPPKPPTVKPKPHKPSPPSKKLDPSKPSPKRTCRLSRSVAPNTSLNKDCKSCWLCIYQCSGKGIVGGGQVIYRYQLGPCVPLSGFAPGFAAASACEAAANAGNTKNPFEGLSPEDLNP